MGIYPDNAALDHDTEIHLREALGQLVAAGVYEDIALASMRRVVKAMGS